MKQIIHLVLRSNRENISLPYRIDGLETKATILYYNIEPVLYTTNNNGDVVSPLYFQLRFTGGGMETNFISYGGASDMIQLPITRFNGWPTTFNQVPIPLWNGKRMESKFQIEVYNEGTSPTLFPFTADTRLLLWILIETTGDNTSHPNSYAYF